MKLAVRELRRRPAGFIVPTGILLLLALLLLYPSAVLDGLYLDSTAAVRTAPADLIVYSEEANRVLLRSRVEPAVRRQVEDVPGVARTGSFDAVLLTGTVAGRSEPVGLAILASEEPLGSEAPAPGEALVDASLRERADVGEGDTLLVGPFRVPIVVAGFVSDTNLWFQSGVVVDKGTWLTMLGRAPDAGAPGSGDPASSAAQPGSAAEPGSAASEASPNADGSSGPGEAGTSEGSQVLLVTLESGADGVAVAAAIDRATGGVTDTLTRAAAVRAMPGVAEQESTFGYIRAVTLGVAFVVVGLFLSFVTLERAGLYAVLKAVGASTRQLFFGVVVQVLLITVTAVTLATAATWGLTHVPLDLPTTMRTARLVETLVTLGSTALIGSTLALRRVARIDPASAIG